MINIAVTAVLSAAAIYFGIQYNEREDQRERERLAREAEDTRARDARARRLARAECINFDIALAERAPFQRNEPLRLALARSIEYYVADCALAGYRVDRNAAQTVLARLAVDGSPRVRRQVATARSRIADRVVMGVSVEERRGAIERLAEAQGQSGVRVGYGVNWESPFGPFRIDVAEAILAPSEGSQPVDSNKLFSFNVGNEF